MIPSFLCKVAVKNHAGAALACRGLQVRGFQKPSGLDHASCHVLVVGGGTAGCTVAAKMTNNFDKGDIYILEPSPSHYYQPLWTLVGGGVRRLEDSRRPMGSVIPKGVRWIQDEATSFNPQENTVSTGKGFIIHYDYLVIATGIETRFDLIPGLVSALEQPDSGVCSNYSRKYVPKTFHAMKRFQSGNAVFTFPNTPVKCAGAPQKICYLAEDYFKKSKKTR